MGDVNGDVYYDLGVGALEDTSGKGNVYIYHSSETGVDTTVDTNITGEDELGNALAFGDVNCDGYNDLAACSVEWGTGPGRVYIFQSNSDGSGIDSQVITKVTESETTAGTTLSGDSTHLGYSIAFGNVNGDGHADRVVSGHFYDSARGSAHIFYGAENGIDDRDFREGETADTTLTGDSSGDNFGKAVGG